MTIAGTRAVVNIGKGKIDNDLKKSRWVWMPKGNYMDHVSKEKESFILKKFEAIQKAFYKIMQWYQSSMKKRFGKKESVSKQGRKKSKPKLTLDDSIVFDDQDADHCIEYKETEEAGDKGGNAEELVSTARPEVSTGRPDIDAARQEDSVVEPRTPWNGYLTKRRKTKQKSDKTGHEMEKCVKTKPNQSQSQFREEKQRKHIT
ncbi:hypothetical protein Tco_0924065 [Tanacetum coccineum]|uniref:Uncharacterized protein n=1 Tax=Tanacetum coccineum TaxID=301880 RepID=A0ABQ5D606_9ASTR